MVENIVGFIVIAGIAGITAAIVYTLYTWPFLYYAVRYTECTHRFKVGKIKNAHKLTPHQISGKQYYEVRLLTGASTTETISEYREIFNAYVNKAEIEGLTLDPRARTLDITNGLQWLEDNAETIKKIVEETNKAYFKDLEDVRQQAKKFEL